MEALIKKENVDILEHRMLLVDVYNDVCFCFFRVAYLQSKNFSKADITQMVRNAPFLLNFSVERLDNRLGFFQKELELNVKKVSKVGEIYIFPCQLHLVMLNRVFLIGMNE